ncbi:hypothetical protein Tco_1170560, partial [Tanacetum coccineum]
MLLTSDLDHPSVGQLLWSTFPALVVLVVQLCWLCQRGLFLAKYLLMTWQSRRYHYFLHIFAFFLLITMAKKDMEKDTSKLTQPNLDALIEKYDILLDLHPRIPPSDSLMLELPNDVI